MKFKKRLSLKRSRATGKRQTLTLIISNVYMNKRMRKILQKIGLIKKFSLLRFIKKRLTSSQVGPVRKLIMRESRKPAIVGFVLILVVVSAYFLFFSSNDVLAEWWDTNWHYRKAITITNSGSTQTNTQVKILSNYNISTDVTNGKVQVDLDDLRFTDINGAEIKYWIEDSTNASIDVWGFLPSVSASGATIYMYYGNTNAGAGKSTVGTSSYPGVSCKSILLSGVSTDGAYYIDPTGEESTNKFQAYCDLNTDDGGWTLAVRLNTNDATTQQWSSSFWTSSSEQGTLSDSDDYLSPAYYTLSAWDEILTDYKYTTGQVKRMAASFTGSNTGTLKSQTIRTLSNSNPSWTRTYTNNTDASSWYGSTLIFQTIGNGTDNFRIWYNQVAVSACNPAGGIGCQGDGGNWYNEVSFPSTQVSCQENYIRGTLGTNGGGSLMTETLLSPADVYDSGIMYISVREDTISTSGHTVTSGVPVTEEKGPGPVGYWSFDEGYGTTAQDRTSNNNDGTITGATWQAEDLCKSGKCLSFDGNGDWITLTSEPFTSSDADYTISLWARWNTVPTGGHMRYISWGGTSGRYFFGYNYSSQKIDVGHGGITVTPSDASYKPTANVWEYWTVTNSGTTTKFYKDGVLINTESHASTGTISAGDPVRIGRQFLTNTEYFNGFIDDVKIYPYARTPAQIKADYNSGGGSSSKGSSASLGGRTSQGNYLSDGLVGYWKMDEASGNAIDSSGNNNTGTWYGTGSHYPAGKFGNGGGFNGTDDYVEIGTSSIGAISGSSARTFSLWFKPNATQNKNLLGYGATVSAQLWDVLLYNGNVGVHVYNSGTEAGTPYTVGEWQNVVFTYDGTTIRSYMNGVYKNSANWSLNTGTTNGLNIGKGIHSAYHYFNGKLDEVRIYNRALSEREVKALYEYAPGPVAYYDFEESSGTTLYDKSGHGYNSSSFIGSPTWSSGKYGGALYLDGTNDYINLPTSIWDKTPDKVTMSIWVKGNNQNTNTCLIYAAPNQKINVHAPQGGTTMFWDYGNACCTGRISKVMPSEWINDNWTHFVFVSNLETSSMKIYANGILWHSGSTTQEMTVSPTSFTLGSGTTGASKWRGYIDEFKIYDYERTQKQILEDMLARRGGGQAAPVAYYKFDEGYGTTAKDSMGSGIEATGGIIAEVDGYRIHTFTSSGTFTVNKGSGNVEVLVVAGGGSGGGYGGNDGAGGGGAGGLIYNSGYSVAVGANITVTVGAGGASATTQGELGNNGSNSVFDTLTAIGGGGGGTEGAVRVGQPGGSGGGAGGYAVKSGGAGTAGQGNNGGDCTGPGDGGGGGAGAVGQSGTTGIGGNGLQYSISGVPTYYAGGGGASGDKRNGRGLSGGIGGMGGGGNGQDASVSSLPEDGTANTGGGGGGAAGSNSTYGAGTTYPSGSGGSGMVIVRYLIKSAGNDGANNGANWTNSGKLGKALDFNGTNSYVRITQTLSTPITITGWAKIIDTSKTANTFFNSYPHAVLGISLNRLGNGEIYVYIGNGSSWLGAPGIISSVNMVQSRWYQVAFVSDGSISKLYLDGVSVGTSAIVPSGWGSYYDFGEIVQGGEYMKGQLDEYKIYNYALTEEEIKQEYNQGKVSVMGAVGGDGSGSSSSAGTAEYCVPGSSDSCDPPVAEWNFEEHTGTSAYDSSGNGNTGTLTNGPIWYSPGKYGSALSFDGTDDYVGVADGASLDITDAVTVSAWINSDTVPRAAWQGISYKGGEGTNNWHFGIQGSTGKLGGGFGTGAAWDTRLSTYTVPTRWVHVVLVGKANDFIKMYADGIEVYTGALAHGLQTNANSLFIGLGWWGTEYFDGLIDQVRIYDYARTPAQIAWDYNKGKPIAYYKMDKGEGTTIYDSSGNGNNGTLELGSLDQTSAGSVKVNANTAWYNGREGKQNYSLNFDGSDDYVSCEDPTDGSLDFESNDFTLSSWVQIDTNKLAVIVNKMGNVGSSVLPGYGIFFEGGVFLYVIGDGSTLHKINSGQAIDISSTYHLVTAVRDGASWLFYYDGVFLITTNIGSLGSTTNIKDLQVGRDDTGRYFDGQIDDVKIFNYALTADQIKTVYNFGAAHLGTGD